MLLHTNDFENCWEGNFCLPGEKKPFTGTLEVSSDKNPFNLKPVLSYRMNFKDGIHHGVYEEFFKSGKLTYRERFKNNQRHGVREEFFENGNIRLKEYYENGRLL